MVWMGGSFQTFNNCSKNDIKETFADSMTGVCKTFIGRYKQLLPGLLSGLMMKMYLNQDDYSTMIPLDAGAGVNLIVHSKGTFPGFQNFGILLQPGSLTMIKLNRKVYKRLPSPYPSNCENRNKNSYIPGPYTVENCRSACLNDELGKACGKFDTAAIYYKSKKGEKIVDVLNKTDEEYMECVLNFYSNVTMGNVICNCPLLCEEEKFTMTASSSKWPSKTDMPYYKTVLAKILQRKNVTDEFIHDNLLAVYIYYDSMSYEQIEELAVVTLPALLGGIGGVLGLFVGASFYSIAEFLAFIAVVIFGRKQH